MDVFAHVFWTNALFHAKYRQQRLMRYLAAFFGVLPDLIAFIPVFLYIIFSGRLFNGQAFGSGAAMQTNWTFEFAKNAYNYSHSMVIFLAVFALVLIIGNIYLYYKNKHSPVTPYKFWFFWPMLGWALHILIDFPTHPDFYQTPIFFPISNYHNTHGVSWGNPTFMIINYSLLIIVYAGLFYYQKRKRDAAKR